MTLFGITNFGLFCITVLLLNITPGPDTAYIVGRSVAQGRRAGLISAIGISLGCCVHTILSAFGLTALLAASATAFTMIKLAGGAYLIYLGIRMLCTKQENNSKLSVKSYTINDRRPLKKIFLQALITNVLNPKVILFFLSFFPQFVQYDATHKTFAFLLLGAVFAIMTLFWNSGTAMLASTLTQRANNNPRIKQWLENIVGGAFVALGLKLALSKN